LETTTRNHIKAKKVFVISLTLIITSFVFSSGLAHAADENEDKRFIPVSVFNTVKLDYEQFYTRYRLVRLGLAYGLGDIVANTETDEHIQDWYQDHVRNSSTDKVSTIAKNFGNGWYIVPLTFASAVVGTYALPEGNTSSALGTWGERSFRSILVGGPAVVVMQYVTGAYRPKQGDSQWRPFKSNHGVSGHAFIGAIPFLTLARMYDDQWYIKYPLFVASTLAGLSRINDNQHYPSQAALGWYMAWEATGSILERDTNNNRFSIVPLIGHDSYGLQLMMEW
jgi:hypothetical protein